MMQVPSQLSAGILAAAYILGLIPMLGQAEETSLDLPRQWKFQRGDDPRWSEPTFDDKDWEAIRVGKPWDRNYDGFGWYRLKVTIPKDWQNDEGFQQCQHLSLILGSIDDADQAWFNGQRVGQTGSLQGENKRAHWNRLRTYQVPARMVRWGKENVIAVRVHDQNGRGGLFRGPYRLAISNWTDLVQLHLGLGRGDGIFPADKPMEFTVTVQNDVPEVMAGRLNWTIQTDEKTDIHHESTNVTLVAGKAQQIDCRFLPTRPGFYFASCTFIGEGGEVSQRMQLGYAPEKLKSPLTREPDFLTFWKQSREALRRVEPRFEVIPQTDTGNPAIQVYEVKMRSFGNVRVAGWYEVPKKAGRYPAVLRVPGYGQKMRPIGRFEDMVVFSFNVRGHGNSQQDVKGKPSNYWIRGLDNKQGYYYRGAYLDCLRAVDFLVSRQEVDAKRIAVIGGSQGGGFSFATAALDDRIALCAPDIPFMADFVRYFQTSDWPEMDQWITAEEKRTWPRTLRTLSYFDTMNLAPMIRCPVLMGVGLQDGVCPPATNFTLYNRVPGEKEYRVYPFVGHRVEPQHPDLVYAWIRKRFGL